MEMIANARQADESRTSSIGTNDGDSMSIGTSARKSSVASSRSTGECAFFLLLYQFIFRWLIKKMKAKSS